jgi:hypothetical protein
MQRGVALNRLLCLASLDLAAGYADAFSITQLRNSSRSPRHKSAKSPFGASSLRIAK